MICKKCKERMMQDLDAQGRLVWFCVNIACEEVLMLTSH